MNEPDKGWPEAGSTTHSSHIASPTPWAMPPWVCPCTISGWMQRPTSPRHPLAIRDQFGCGRGEQRRRVAHGAAGMRAAAQTDDVGVAGDHIDRFDRDREHGANNLRETRLMPLAA